MSEIYQDIPCWDNGTWTTISYDSRDDFSNAIFTIFKEPGLYEFDDTSILFNEQATVFRTQNVYCISPFKSKDFIYYWDDQKAKCRKGVFYIKDDSIFMIQQPSLNLADLKIYKLVF